MLVALLLSAIPFGLGDKSVDVAAALARDDQCTDATCSLHALQVRGVRSDNGDDEELDQQRLDTKNADSQAPDTGGTMGEGNGQAEQDEDEEPDDLKNEVSVGKGGMRRRRRKDKKGASSTKDWEMTNPSDWHNQPTWSPFVEASALQSSAMMINKDSSGGHITFQMLASSFMVPLEQLPWQDDGIVISGDDTDTDHPTLQSDSASDATWVGILTEVALEAAMVAFEHLLSTPEDRGCSLMGSGVKYKSDEERWTKSTARHFAVQGYNVMVIHSSQAHVTCKGKCRTKHFEMCLDDRGYRSKGYTVVVGIPGRGTQMVVTNTGDGGFRNWCYIGRAKRHGSTVVFS